MSLLFDRLAWVELVYGGRGALDAAGVVPASSGGVWGLPTKEVLERPGWRYVNKTTGQLETDMAKIKQGLSAVYGKDPKDIAEGKRLLREAGLDPERGQFPKLTITAPQNFTQHAEVTVQAYREIAELNITLDIIDQATWTQRSASGQFQAGLAAVFGSAPEPSQTLYRLTTGQGAWNHGFEVKEIDALFVQQRVQVDPAKRKAIIWDMQRKFLDTQHQIVAMAPVPLQYVMREWAMNFPPATSSLSQYQSFDRVWLTDRTGT